MVLAPEHPLVPDLTSAAQRDAVDAYRTASASKDLVRRKVGEREKTGVFTGAFARNPATGRTIPVWIADYVLMEYGTGAIMAVPAHDERDLEFATRYGCRSSGRARRSATDRRTTRRGLTWTIGRAVNSGRSAAWPMRAKHAIIRWLETSGAGQGVGPVPAPRLVHLAPALLGPADSHHLLRRARCRAGARRRICPCSCPLSRTSGPTTAASRRSRGTRVVLRACPVVRRAARRETDVSRQLSRLGLVLPPLSEHRVRRPAVRSERTRGGARWPRTSAGTSTRCSISCTRGSSRWCCTISGI